jgi:predicted phosphoribosyltransferase
MKPMLTRFQNREEAGRMLAAKLTEYANRSDVLVLALPRGGVPVAYQIAKALNAPLDVLLVRKLGVPGQEELAMGAIASGGVCVLNDDVVGYMNEPEEIIVAIVERENKELKRRERAYRDDLPPPDVRGKTVILVDDGLATGSTMRAAVTAMKKMNPARIVVAVPVAAKSVYLEFSEAVGEIACILTPEPFQGVGLWYRDFSQTSDDEVRALLKRASKETQYAN